MPKNALILYASVTGNTEKVAARFRQVFDRKRWSCDFIKAARGTRPDIEWDSYDLICVGSPIMAGLPAKEIMLTVGSGSYGPARGEVPPWELLQRQPMKVKKGVAFVTYTGDRRGPPESLASLAVLEQYMEDQGFKCIGKLACPGRIFRKTAVDFISRGIKGMNVEDASGSIQRFKINPAAPEFANLSGEDRALYEQAAKSAYDEDPIWKVQKVWHWNIQDRPSERDLTKAEIFIEEIIEDYFDDGGWAAPIAQYLCIA